MEQGEEEMTIGKTTKVADDLIVQAHKLALRKQAEIDGGWKLVVIPVQHMFPNCQVRYKTKCKDMKSCDKEIEEIKITFPAKYGDYTLMTQETIEKEKEKLRPPKDFQDDIQRAKKMKFE